MTRISLAYGQGGLDIDLPADRTLVVEPTYSPAAADQHHEVIRAMRNRSRVRPCATCSARGDRRHLDVRRNPRPAAPYRHPGCARKNLRHIRLEDVVILVATGTHRGNSTRRSARWWGTRSPTA